MDQAETNQFLRDQANLLKALVAVQETRLKSVENNLHRLIDIMAKQKADAPEDPGELVNRMATAERRYANLLKRFQERWPDA